MLISIVTPSYNQVRFLEETMQSVLTQNVSELEYFVMDGASTDGSLKIIQRHASQLAGWVSEKDHGQADAINKGLRRSRGEMVAWLNSDDFYLPGALETAARAFEQNPQVGLIYGDVLSVDSESKAFNRQTFAPYTLADLMSFRIISQPAVFMRRSVLEQAGLLDETYHLLLDHHLWLRMARLAPILYVPQTMAAARYHAEAKNVARAAEFGREAFRLVDWMRSTPEYSQTFAREKDNILAGAERLDAFYLLDGKDYRGALAAYRRAWQHNPAPVLKEIHRVIFAVLSLYLPGPLGFLRSVYTRLRSLLRKTSHETR